RSYASALKSWMWRLDPRPDLPTIVRMVEKGFELSEASHAPVMLELRIRACHVTGASAATNNLASLHPSRPCARPVAGEDQPSLAAVGPHAARAAGGFRLRPPLAPAEHLP